MAPHDAGFARSAVVIVTSETPEERTERIRAEVATWPRLTPERKAELRRLLLPAADRLRARNAARAAKEGGDSK